MKAQIITDRQQWNDFVAASELCNLTQTYEWGELMSKRHSDSLHVGVVKDDGSLCAVMLVLVSTVPALRVPYFYAPRGPIVEDPASPAMTLLLNFVKAEAHKRGACMLKVEPGVPDDDRTWLNALRHYGFRSIPYAHHLRHEWVTDIRADEQELMSKMHKKTRQYIRTSARTGVVIRESHEQSGIDAFYRIYCETGERSEFMVLNKEYYENFLRLYKDNAALLIAEYDNRIIAAAIVVRLGRWSWNMYEAASDESREMRVNYLLQWQRILWAKSHGCWYFNSRGIPDVLEEGNELYGVYNFKRGFGGYAMRSLETQDLVYRPLVYKTYRTLLDGKHWYEERQAEKKKAEEKKKAAQKQAVREAAQQALPTPAASAQEKTSAQKVPAAVTSMPQIPETPRPEAVANAQKLPQVPETPRPAATDRPRKQKKAPKPAAEQPLEVENTSGK
ncbi:lipid II:glycine glycyltransferase FemX [Dictyobacter kobayashii]|uniref:Methicillin resistance protein n=1 Tax=Dictyobacter kobayashii TaxID=2014872 RepID=A0A402AXH3_9CHLR|nr:peptidoglycan bridge formation glycyltransferase FemA/FemB family protein [Dictyobacter kobayashii]GCE23787.1 hypothetical protein KDK_75870 [Dictyobacter kobayashii]